ncbi:hypothetical protein SAMN04515678_101563 [Roseivivax sediminis]|uniref:N-acetyltransferase domain-containing protein n=2 Tax=Roseivivax sediminis TaxID=936889 RepID=A0A1I1TK06_9RHOB|nr:hypothetical protein SAMN04515678_101563 [Roseivivax sediminis]
MRRKTQETRHAADEDHEGRSSSEERPDLRIDSYDARVLEISYAHIELLHELTIGVFWPHRRDDLRFFVDLGCGYVAVDAIGRPMASAMAFGDGEEVNFLGMMVTPPRLQSHGAGRWLLRRLMEERPGVDMRLSATRSGYRLYESAGFIPVDVIRQHQGIVTRVEAPCAAEGVTVRKMRTEDHSAVRALDLVAFGAGRQRTLEYLLAMTEGVVAVRDNEPCGYALCRRFGRGEVIGPLVADDEQVAMMLAAPFVQRAEGRFLRIDTPDRGERFGGFLAAAGMGVFDTVTEMYIGNDRRPREGVRIFGLAAQSLG